MRTSYARAFSNGQDGRSQKGISRKQSTKQKLDSAIRPELHALERRQLLNGAIDTSFGTIGKAITDFGNTPDLGDGLVTLPDGSFIVAGESNGRFALAKYTASGAVDTS